MNRSISTGPPTIVYRDNNYPAANPTDIDIKRFVTASLYTLEADGFTFTFPTDPIAGFQAVRKQTIDSYRAVANSHPTARDMTFIFGSPAMAIPPGGRAISSPEKNADEWPTGNNKPTQAIPKKPIAVFVLSDEEDEKTPCPGFERSKTRESPTPDQPVGGSGQGHKRGRSAGGPESAPDVGISLPDFLPEVSHSGCSGGGGEAETNKATTATPNGNGNTPGSPRIRKSDFLGDHPNFHQAAEETGRSLNWVHGMYCERRLSIGGESAMTEPAKSPCTGCVNRMKIKRPGPCMFLVAGGDGNFSSFKCTSCVKRGINCRVNGKVFYD